jgi:zinc/manganese transport system substrate-binding protein
MNIRRFSIVPFLLLTLLCLSPARASLTVASLSTVTTDLAREIGGTNVTVLAIIGPGVDPHEFEPTPADVKKVADADLVLFTGKGMEGYLTKLEDTAGNPGKFVDVGRSIPSLSMTEGGRTVDDPHWWHSVENMKQAVRTVAEALEKADPSEAPSYKRKESAYLAQLDELERWIRVKVAALPHDRRKLVTSHDALQYFAKDYGFTIYPVKGISTSEDPSSRHVKEIIAVIKDQGVKSVFFESIENPRALRQIAEETGAVPGGTLYSDGLGDSPEGNTYERMMRHNVSTIVNGLK